jgi:ankyrin repeat protein
MEFNLKQILESGNVNELREDENHIMMTPLIKYTLRGDIESVIKLLNAGANPNIGDDWGCTPLEIVCQKRNLKLCEILLLHGANPNYKNIESGTPLMEIAKPYLGDFDKNIYIKITQLLLEHGADTYIKDRYDKDILDYLEYYNFCKMDVHNKIQKLIIRWRAALIIQYNIKAKLFRNRIKKRIETKKLLLKETILPMDLIKIVKGYV